MREKTAAIAAMCATALFAIAVWVLITSAILTPPRNATPRQAERVFTRNDTLWVCDAGTCRWISPSWTRCPRRTAP